MTSYVVATVKDWNIARFHENTARLEGDWHLITDRSELTAERLHVLAPRYVFFPHWSWIVPDEVLHSFECVCFHMTDVPYGRGGSPLQNLIARGHQATQLTALRMTAELDAGPVYLKRPLGLGGAAHEIYERASHLTWEGIAEIVKAQPVPKPQAGEVTTFKRRTPDMSELPEAGHLVDLYDHVRMLDAPGYPHAILRHGEFEIHLTDAVLQADGEVLQARVTVRKKRP